MSLDRAESFARSGTRSAHRAAVLDACAYAETWLAFRTARDRVPGVQAAVLHDGDVVHASAHGLADVATATPLTSEHRFRVASHSKTFTATAVVQLAEQGRLRLDDTIGQHLGELAAEPIGAVTLRELLAHGGGVIRDGRDGDHWQLARPFPDGATLREVAADEATVLARNERFKYSNVGFSLLGAVVEVVTDRSYADHVRSAVLDPLRLAATTPDIDPGAVADHATGYTSLAYAPERIPFDHIATGAMAAATGFSSTATDLVRWAAAHFPGDERVLSDDAKRQMQHTAWTVEGAGEYGLGLEIGKVGERRVVGHSGGFPGFITRTWWDPVERIAVSVLTNAVDGPASVLAEGVFRFLDLAGRDGGDRDADLTPYTGRFMTLWGVFDVVALGGQLWSLAPVLDDPVAVAQRLEVLDADTLRIADGPGYGSPGERYVYERDGAGRVVSVRGSSGTTALPEQAFRAQLAGFDRIRLGAAARLPLTRGPREHGRMPPLGIGSS